MNDNYQIVLFKNKIKKKIINHFKTHKRGLDYYNKLIEISNNVIFPKEYLNGYKCDFELAFIERTVGTFLPYFMKDEFGRQLKIDLDDKDYNISKISKYNIEEEFLDYSTKKKITSKELIKKYLDRDGIKLVSKLNNKIIVQNDSVFNLFTFKNEEDCGRFIDSMTEYFNSIKRIDCMLVKDSSTIQRKYLYELLVKEGFPKSYLFRQSTTHPIKK